MAKQHAFKDCRTKADHHNIVPCDVFFRCGVFNYRYEWDWAKNFPDEIKDTTVPGIACDPDGNVYVACRTKGFPVACFDTDGNFIRYYGRSLDIGEMHGIYVDSDFNVWIADDVYNVIYKLDRNDNLLLTIGEKGKGSDTGVDMTIKSHLKYLTIRRSAGPFNKPTKAVVGPDKRVFVSDGYANAAVHVFTPEGKLVKSWGAPGNLVGEFNIVHSLCVDSRNRVWVADRDNDRVQIFDTEGNVLHVITGIVYAADVWTDNRHVYVGELDGRMSIYDMDYQLVAQIGYFHSPYKIHSLCGDYKGNVYFGLFNEYPVVKLKLI